MHNDNVFHAQTACCFLAACAICSSIGDGRVVYIDIAHEVDLCFYSLPIIYTYVVEWESDIMISNHSNIDLHG